MILTLDTRDSAPFEIGVTLDVALCFPTFPPERQLKIANAICAEQVAGWIGAEPHRADELRPVQKEYRKAAQRASYGSLKKRRQKAMVAGQSFLPLIKEAAFGELPLLYGQHARLSRHRIASYLCPALEGGYEENYESRLRDRKENDIWPWYPVAHLAAAYQALARLEAGADDSFAFDCQDLDFHLRVVMLAAEFAKHFRQVPELSDIGAKLIDIEIVI